MTNPLYAEIDSLRARIEELEAENEILRELVDGVAEIVEICHVTFPAQIAWKKDWLEKAREVLK